MTALAYVLMGAIFLWLLLNFPKPIIGILCAIAAIVGGAILWGESQRQRAQVERDLVVIQVGLDENICAIDGKFPLYSTIKNGSKGTVLSVDFSVKGFEKGHSDPLFETNRLEYHSDNILAPGGTIQLCWVLPRHAQAPEIPEDPRLDIWFVEDWEATLENISFAP